MSYYGPTLWGIAVFSDDHVPNSAQRKKVQGTLASVPKLALISDSTVMRYIATGMGWAPGAGDRIKAFKSSELEKAIRIHLWYDDVQHVISIKDRLMRELGLKDKAA